MNLLSEGKFVATTSKCAHCGTLFSLPLPTSSRRVILQLLLHHNDKLCTLSFAIYPARKKKKKTCFLVIKAITAGVQEKYAHILVTLQRSSCMSFVSIKITVST